MARKNIAFPQVLKNAEMKSIVIIYWDHAEYYTCNSYRPGYTYWNGEGDDKYDPFNELDMNLNSGYRFVHPARDNYTEQEARIAELEAQIKNMRESCPEGGCLVELEEVA